MEAAILWIRPRRVIPLHEELLPLRRRQQRHLGQPLRGVRDHRRQHLPQVYRHPFDGRGVFSNSITIYFEADLRPQLEGKPISVIYINNAEFGGFFRLDKRCQSGFLAINTVGDPKTNLISQLLDQVKIGSKVSDVAVSISLPRALLEQLTKKETSPPAEKK